MLILGTWLELGERAEDLHRQAGREARDAGIDMLFACGDLAGLAAEASASRAKLRQHRQPYSAARSFLSPGLTVLIKGSRSARMEQVANALVCITGGSDRMLKMLFEQWATDFSASNVFRYLSFRAICAVLTTLLFSFPVGPTLIRRLERIGAVEPIPRRWAEHPP